MIKKIILSTIIGCTVLATSLLSSAKAENSWNINQTFIVASAILEAYSEPTLQAKSRFSLYHGMTVTPTDIKIQDGVTWYKVGNSATWIPAIEIEGKAALVEASEFKLPHIIDAYGVLNQPHRFAVKMAKMPGAKAMMETYELVDGKYVFRNLYEAKYRKDGPKDDYGDLKTPGGPVIRYLYRTTRTNMSGRDATGKSFGAYKVSYPMPHDALPYLLSGKMSIAQYNNIPAINRIGEMLHPHPQSMMGADIVLHTAKKGTRGCIMIDNDKMSSLYHEDLVTENDKEIIPLIIYDEDVVAPPVGELF